MKILLDTNVVLDYFLAREPNKLNTEKIFELIYSGEIEGVLTANSITDIYYIAEKRLGREKTRQTIYYLLMTFFIIPVGGEDCLEAFKNEIPDFEDAVVIACAVRDSVDYIVTNDIDFQKIECSNIPIVSTEKFIGQAGG